MELRMREEPYTISPWTAFKKPSRLVIETDCRTGELDEWP